MPDPNPGRPANGSTKGRDGFLDATRGGAKRGEGELIPGLAEPLLFAVPRLVGEHPFPGAGGRFSFLAPDFFELRALRLGAAGPETVELFEQQLACQEPVRCLVTGGLAFHPQSRRAMEQHDAG